jgi:hypothetical protein
MSRGRQRREPALAGRLPARTRRRPEEHRVGDAVGDRVEERAARSGPTGVACHRPIEDVRDARGDHAEDGDEEVAGGDEERGADGEREPDDRQDIRIEPGTL